MKNSKETPETNQHARDICFFQFLFFSLNSLSTVVFMLNFVLFFKFPVRMKEHVSCYKTDQRHTTFIFSTNFCLGTDIGRGDEGGRGPFCHAFQMWLTFFCMLCLLFLSLLLLYITKSTPTSTHGGDYFSLFFYFFWPFFFL